MHTYHSKNFNQLKFSSVNANDTNKCLDKISCLYHIGFLINVQGHHPILWVHFQVTG